MSSKLEYQPLSEDEFRLIKLLPSSSASALLRVELFHNSLHAPHLPYVALSYTWQTRSERDNDTVDSHEVLIVNDHEISLHTNLVSALRRIRTEVPQCIWADALCIDQSNAVERGQQVMLMREIFSFATDVLAWLGPQADDSDIAMDFLGLLARASSDKQLEEWVFSEGLLPSYYPTWEAFRRLMNRSWWKRAWIVQEFALAQEVTFLCGDRRLSVHDFEAADRELFVHFSTAKNKQVTALRNVIAINARTFDPARNLLDLRRRLRRGEPVSALASLQMTRLSQATDPRDHLFAKLGLSGRELAELCPPNYEMKAEDVWFGFFQKYIKEKKDLYIICLAGMQPRTYRYLPSWLPDWGPSSPKYPLRSLAGGVQPHWPHFDAANGTQAIITLSSNWISPDTILSCHGLQIDTIDGVAGDDRADMPRSVRQSRSSKNAYETTSGAFQALCRTVTANTDRMGEWGPPPPDFNFIFAKRWQELNLAVAQYELDPHQALPLPLYPRASGFERAWRSMRGLEFGGEALRVLVQAGLEAEATRDSRLESSEEEGLESTTASSYPLWTALEHSAGQVCLDRYVFTTDGGRLGIGPATAEPGDRVVLLLGCRVPVLLRPQEQYYRLIGECYTDGIMYGEAMAKAGSDEVPQPVETFEIF